MFNKSPHRLARTGEPARPERAWSRPSARSFLLGLSLAAPVSAQRTWCPLETEGFGDTGNELTTLAIDFLGELHVGTWNSAGAQLWRLSGTWQQVATPWSAENTALLTGVVHQGDLVVGTLNETTGAEAWRYDPTGPVWTQIGENGLDGGDSASAVDRMAVFGGELYAGLCNQAVGSQVRVYRNGTWMQVNSDGFACGPDNAEVYGLVEFGGSLYATTNNNDGCQVWAWNGLGPWQRVDPGGSCSDGGFLDGGWQSGAHALAVLGNPPALWLGTENEKGAEVWSYDGATWTQRADDGFGVPDNFIVHDFAELGGVLYAATQNNVDGAEVWEWEGGQDWRPIAVEGFGATNSLVFEFGVIDDDLLATTLDDVDGADVWKLGLGELYCGAVVNSTGLPAALCAEGSQTVVANDLTLHAHRLPPNQFGYFLASQTQGLVHAPPGSMGDLCLSGQILRFTGQLQDSGSAGAFSADLDLAAFPPPYDGPVLPGQTWNFQAWYRDVGGTSNFTYAAEIEFF